MATALPIEIFRLLEDKIGADEAIKVSDAIELSLAHIETKASETALQKKLEIKDELTKELASKADVLQAKTELNGKIDNLKTELKAEILLVETRLNAKITLYFVILLSAIFITNTNAIDIIAKLFSFVK